MIAALYVLTDGPYFGLPDVDPWDEPRDARLYPGPHAVVAHPPCQRWGRYWSGGPSARVRRAKGDDGGCFAAALASVRRWGGVLEHPEASHAWPHHGIPKPPKSGGWIHDGLPSHPAGSGWTCCVEQGHYGHRARKATWLYAVLPIARSAHLPDLRWGPSGTKPRLDVGFHSKEERARFMKPPKGISQEERSARRSFLGEYATTTGKEWCSPERLTRYEMRATPIPFRDLLLSIARMMPVPYLSVAQQVAA